SSPATAVAIPNAATVTQNFALTPVPGTIQGVVSDSATVAIVGATVTLSTGASTTTVAGGAYSFTSVPPGTYSVTASATNYSSVTMPGVVVVNAGTATRNITLVLMPGMVRGAVTDPGGTPISGATVQLSNGLSATTNAAGAYTITAVASGAYSATASAPTFNSTTTPGIAVTPGGVTT